MISNISKLEKLLINCQYLNGLYIIIDNVKDGLFNWDYPFEVLTRLSPTNLFKFKFNFYFKPKPESLKLFLDNWEGRHPMLLQTIQDDLWRLLDCNYNIDLINLLNTGNY